MTAIEDKDAIRELLAEYCFRLDDGRYDDMASLFTEDGTWETAFGKASGRAAIAKLAADIRARSGADRPRAHRESASRPTAAANASPRAG